MNGVRCRYTNLDLGVTKGTSGGVIALLSFLKGSRVEGSHWASVKGKGRPQRRNAKQNKRKSNHCILKVNFGKWSTRKGNDVIEMNEAEMGGILASRAMNGPAEGKKRRETECGGHSSPLL
jgi:hypothetical protein